MARVEIAIPDDLYELAVAVGLDISLIAQQALAAELDRSEQIRGFDAFLEELEAEQGLPFLEGDPTDDDPWWVE